MFSGPNGSGKSELIGQLQKSNIPLGPVVNADRILAELTKSGFVDLSDYLLRNINQSNWNLALDTNDEIQSRVKKVKDVPEVRISENTIICNSANLDSYGAALITDFIRHQLVEQQRSFSFETVMSHSQKVAFLDLAKAVNYTTYLYYIATENAQINIERIKNRQKKGGHGVASNKVVSRYKRSLNLLLDALQTADRAFVLDNSKRRNFVVLEKKYDGLIYPQSKSIPLWVDQYVISQL
jgi:predicted ABC-type ATPase